MLQQSLQTLTQIDWFNIRVGYSVPLVRRNEKTFLTFVRLGLLILFIKKLYQPFLSYYVF